jgi:hypothetical protein
MGMEGAPLSFGVMLAHLQKVIAAIPDPRQASNAQRYSLQDIVLGAFSVFYMQCSSFLEHQRQMESRQGHNNAQRLFGLVQIPTNTQLRNVLDEVAAKQLLPLFVWLYQALQAQGYLKAYEVLKGQHLVGLDGTEYFSSQQIHCEQCSQRTSKQGVVSYHHTAILPVIVAPNRAEVLTLMPEFVHPQDGTEKQDSETAAAKRWITSHHGLFRPGTLTLLGDDLYSRQPMCQTCLDHQCHFIFTCLPSSHPTLYDWLEYLERTGDLHTHTERYWNGRYFEQRQYRYALQVPLRDEQPALDAHWCEVTVTRASNGQPLYQNAWVTSHALDSTSVADVVSAARARWKSENENHNVLKTQGYHLEHNFGHGDHHLSMTLLTLNLLAFLFHTVLHLVDTSYQRIRAQRGTRKGFFQDIQSLTKYLLFDSWPHLIDFMLDDSTPAIPRNTS